MINLMNFWNLLYATLICILKEKSLIIVFLPRIIVGYT
jgi:hypothetical protein